MKTLINPSIKKLFLALLLLLFSSFFVLANEEDASENQGSITSETQIDTSTIFEMPSFSSETMIEIYRPIKLVNQEYAIPRPVKLTNYHSNMSVIFQKDTKVADENGNLLAPLLNPARTTLSNKVYIPLPEEKLVYEFYITFGNYCDEISSSKSTFRDSDQKSLCSTPTEHFFPNARLVFPLPERVSANSFELRFFDTTRWVWRKQLFTYEENTNLIKLDLPKSGLIAFVNNSGAKVVQSKTSTQQITLPIPDDIVNDKFTIKYYDLSKKIWLDKEFSIDTRNNQVSFLSSDSSIIAFLPSAVSASSVVLQKPNLFLDVKASDWFYDDISVLIKRGVFKSDTTRYFRPDEQINRAEASKILREAFDLPPATKIDLNDVLATDWFANSAQSVIDLGIMSPYFNNQFLAEKKLSRAEVLMVILRAGKIKIKEGMNQIGAEKKRDVLINDWYSSAVGFGIVNGIISLDSPLFLPNASVTRAQFAKMINKTIEYIESANKNDLEENFGKKLDEKMVFNPTDLIVFRKDYVNLESGEDILRLKKILYHFDFFKGKFDQNFDIDLQDALKKFQFHYGIFSNENQLGIGRFGSETRNKINQIIPSLR